MADGDERGECPICGSEFDDPDAFRDHLGEEHDLYDEEGATTTTLWVPTFAVDPDPDVEATIPEDPVPAVAATATRERAPVGLIVLVLLLIVFGGGLVLFIQSDDGANTAADSPLVATGSGTANSSAPSATAAGAASSDATASPSPTDASTDGTTTSGEPTTATTGAPSGTVPVTEPPPSSTTTVTTAPPANFVAPTTTAAHVDNCSRDHGRWVVTYSWKYVGGTGWAPLPSYTAIAGGRYRHTVTLPSNGNTPITTVGVVDSNGQQHNVALSPTLSTNNC